MPCRDDDRDDHLIPELRSRNDALAADLCKARGLLLTLSHVLDHNTVSRAVVDALQVQLAAHKNHRELDKHRALAMVESKKSSIVGTIAKIRELGGFPNPSLLEEVDNLNSQLQEIKNTDPFETDLY